MRVADANKRELGLLRRHIAVAIGDALASSDVLHCEDLRADAHRGPIGAVGEPVERATRDSVRIDDVGLEQRGVQLR
ncbi:hypothetical protein ACFPRL_00765 [Pseudoclavibacter helvolus]